MYEVKRVTRNDCAPFVLGIHYAKRWPSISLAYGLFREGSLVGVVTFGTPPSATLRAGICGPELQGSVIELNRLVLSDNGKNEASLLVGRALRMLPAGSVVVSFADCEQGHVGYIYQATNFIYCGLSAKRTDWKIRGREHLHGQTVADEFRGVANRAAAMREKYGSDFYLSPRSRKHRYVYFTGSKAQKKKALLSLRYKVEKYPKAVA